jgi:hypothetical protein
MIEAGIFNENDHVELINGELRAMSPINAGHAGKNKCLNRLFSAFRFAESVSFLRNPFPHTAPATTVFGWLRPHSSPNDEASELWAGRRY